MKTAVEQAVDALRLWSNAWDEFDRTGKNKPQPIEEVIAPFIQVEEQQKVEFVFRAYSEKLSTGKDFVEIVNSMRTFKQQEQ